MTTTEERETIDPADRDDVPRCWAGAARGSQGSFMFSRTTRPWNWLELSAEDSDKLWTLLGGFVAYFNARYAERPDKRIPPCWAEHGALVEELTTLFWARWQAFESPHGSIGGAQYWHSYTLPSFYERMGRWLGDRLLTCQHGRHLEVENPEVATLRSWDVRSETISSLDFVLRTHASGSATAGESAPGIVVAFLDREEDQQ